MKSDKLLACHFALVAAANALAWGSQLHRDVTAVALGSLPPTAPTWLVADATIARAAFQSNQPDRWRGWPSTCLKHENDPDHFLDAELLAQFGLTLETIPPLRREYVRAMAIAKHEHPENVDPHDPNKDVARTQEWPGFVLHAVAEHYAKLQAAFNQVRILEKLDDPNRAVQLEEARGIAIAELGQLSHFVADIAQPLHTTKHYNGWVGENPDGFKWREKFHAYVDESWPTATTVSLDDIRASVQTEATVTASDPWKDVLAYFQRSHEKMKPLYVLERDGRLDGPDGRAMLVSRLGDAATTLRALVWAAYESSEPTEKQVETWVFYDQRAAAPASRPAK